MKNFYNIEDIKITEPKKNRLSALSATLILIAVLCFALLTSCRTMQPLPPVVKTDSVYIRQIEYDSIYIDRSHETDRSRDTVRILDRITEYRYKLLRDTLTIQHTDSIPYRVEVVKPLTRWQTACIRHYPYALGAIALLALYALRKPIMKLIKLII